MSLLALFQRTRLAPAVTVPAFAPAPVAAPVIAEPVVEEPVDELLHAWTTRVAVRSGALPGSTVLDLTRSGHVATLEVALDGVVDHYPAVVSQTRRLAAALGRPVEQVTIEASATQRGDRCRVIVVDEHSPIYATTSTTAPVVGATDSRIRIGMFADEAPATWELFNARGAVHGAVFGGPDSGRTELLRTILAAAGAHPYVDTHVIDPAGDLVGSQSIARTPQTAHATLWDLCATAEGRGHQLRADGSTVWNTGAERRLQLLVVDGLEALAGDKSLHTLARIGRKVGIAVVGAADSASILSCGDAATRDELARINLAVLRTTDTTTKDVLRIRHLVTDLPPRWHTGADTRGVGYLPRQRNAMFRADLS